MESQVGKGSLDISISLSLFMRIIFSIFTNYRNDNLITHAPTPKQGHPASQALASKINQYSSCSLLHAKMSRWVCCCGDSSSDHPARGQINSIENDYLLPGSSFDEGSSSGGSQRNRLGWSGRNSSKNKNKYASKKPAVTHSVVGLDSPSGDYEPPVVPPSQKLPTYEEFRLLKTVGRGAFGKV